MSKHELTHFCGCNKKSPCNIAKLFINYPDKLYRHLEVNMMVDGIPLNVFLAKRRTEQKAGKE